MIGWMDGVYLFGGVLVRTLTLHLEINFMCAAHTHSNNTGDRLRQQLALLRTPREVRHGGAEEAVVRCASLNPDLQTLGCSSQVGPTPIHMRDPSHDDTFPFLSIPCLIGSRPTPRGSLSAASASPSPGMVRFALRASPAPLNQKPYRNQPNILRTSHRERRRRRQHHGCPKGWATCDWKGDTRPPAHLLTFLHPTPQATSTC